MSHVDCERCAVYQTHWVVARQQHRCASCCYRIPPGAQYERHHWVHDGTAGSEACCWACAAALYRLRELGRECPAPDWLIDYLREELDWEGARDSRQTMREERGMLAGIIRRIRAARRERPWCAA